MTQPKSAILGFDAVLFFIRLLHEENSSKKNSRRREKVARFCTEEARKRKRQLEESTCRLHTTLNPSVKKQFNIAGCWNDSL